LKNCKKLGDIYHDYIANEYTQAILPAKHIEYNSVVVEKEQVYRIRETPIEIIKASCEKDCSNYEVRKAILAKRTAFKYKLPMFTRKISPILAFTTISPDNFDCAWIFPRGIVACKKQKKQSSITFETMLTLTLDISYHTLVT